jgi:hypothetical protein
LHLSFFRQIYAEFLASWMVRLSFSPVIPQIIANQWVHSFT